VRRLTGARRRRGVLVRRMLIAADLIALLVAFVLAEAVLAGPGAGNIDEWPVLVAIVPLWIVIGHLYGLYDRDEARADYSTVDDVAGIFHLVTVGVWIVLVLGNASGVYPDFAKLVGFWALAIVLVPLARTMARRVARRSALFVQNVIIVGAGDVGQLVARKMLQHPEYGINIVGFVDDHPRELRPELSGIAMLGGSEVLADSVELHEVDRVVVAFSQGSARALVTLLRTLRGADVQIDIVPRLFDVVGPRITNHAIEALPLIGLPPVRLTRFSQTTKRLIDIVGASLALAATAPLFALFALLIRRDSPGPVLFRQTRLGLGMREFTTLKFRTMRVGIGDDAHREYIRSTMDAGASVGDNGMYKLERVGDVTRFGRWLRRTSLDELPQLVNVLRGEMSLVGPRPCIRYETEHFQPYHFERFLVPAGITGLWQVTARARSTFGEALDMDVVYARAWSLRLDLRLLCQTPLRVLRQSGTA
jgi:exopolysaccharide biosynthesis polyprenyl glycosylphosphotransferase